MKNTMKKIGFYGLCLGVLGLSGSAIQACPHDGANKDFVKIHNVEYERVYTLAPTEGTPLIFNIDVCGYDKDGWKEVKYYLDDQYIGTTRPEGLYESKGDGCSEYPELTRRIESRYAESENFFGEEKHTLKAVLEDCDGNTVEDTYIIEVE